MLQDIKYTVSNASVYKLMLLYIVSQDAMLKRIVINPNGSLDLSLSGIHIGFAGFLRKHVAHTILATLFTYSKRQSSISYTVLL